MRLNYLPQENILENKLGKTLFPMVCGKWEEGGDLSGFEGRHYKTEDHKGRYDHEMEMSFNEC